MKITPAIDLREGRCVQLVGGNYERELFALDNPVEVAQGWIDQGFLQLHVVDLDRATSRGTNIDVVRRIGQLTRDYPELSVRVGGGIRTNSDIRELFDAGATSIVVGTQAIMNPQWFEQCAQSFPGKLYVAIEVDHSHVRIAGWQADADQTREELVSRFSTYDIAGLFVTAIHVEGQQQGTDIELFQTIRSLTDQPIVASGGVTTLNDIDELEKIGIDEAVLGAALYSNPDLARTLIGHQKGRDV